VGGFRYELGERLADLLREQGYQAELRRRWAALPSVTATAKPAVASAAEKIIGEALSADFYPLMQDTHRDAKAADLRKAMKERGYQIISGEGAYAPFKARGWFECGKIDKLGHEKHASNLFSRLIGEELEEVKRHIIGLLKAGWSSVRVVTDHAGFFFPVAYPRLPCRSI